jgi:hypothetical protein
MSVLEIALELGGFYEGGDGSGGWADVSVFRVARITRLLRVVRVTRILRYVRALRMLVYSIACTLKSLICSAVLLMLLMYMFGIVFTSAASGALEEGQLPQEVVSTLKKYWGSVGTSVLTLFMAITNGVAWDEALDPLGQIHWVWTLLFIIFIAFSMFAVLNVMTGVFCQSAMESAARDQEMLIHAQLQNKAQYVKRARSLFQEIDQDDSGVITIQQLEHRLQESDVRNWLDSLEIDAEDAWTLFKLLDSDQSNVIDVEEFAMGCLRLKGNARNIDLQRVLYEQKGIKKRLGLVHRTSTAEASDPYGPDTPGSVPPRHRASWGSGHSAFSQGSAK